MFTLEVVGAALREKDVFKVRNIYCFFFSDASAKDRQNGEKIMFKTSVSFDNDISLVHTRKNPTTCYEVVLSTLIQTCCDKINNTRL